MKSPITGKEMKLTKERRSMDFRKETFEIVFHYYKCEDSGEQFTTTELDEVNMNQVYNQYRDKFNIPFPDEIIRIREKYGLSAAKMSEIFGFGVNSYRQYEAGEMPSVANAKLIQMVDDPKKFIDMVELCGTLDEKARANIFRKHNYWLKKRKEIFSI
jgi:putative zinc finger/helix-turn-helix YgiT family protein